MRHVAKHSGGGKRAATCRKATKHALVVAAKKDLKTEAVKISPSVFEERPPERPFYLEPASCAISKPDLSVSITPWCPPVPVRTVPMGTVSTNPLFADWTAERKYIVAADIANEALGAVVAKCLPGALIADLCRFGDEAIGRGLAKKFPPPNENVYSMGIAFPTCVSPNQLICNYSPLQGDKTRLHLRDVAKIKLGVQVDGFPAIVAHTVIVTDGADVVDGPPAEALLAAYDALCKVCRTIRAGVLGTELIKHLHDSAAQYHVNNVERTSISLIDRNNLEGSKRIYAVPDPPGSLKDFEVEEHEVYCVTTMMSTGTGKAKFSKEKSTLYMNKPEVEYSPRRKTSQQLLTGLQALPHFPFSFRNIECPEWKSGMAELEENFVVRRFGVLTDHDSSAIVTQFSSTVYVPPNGAPARILTLHPHIPHATSKYSTPQLHDGFVSDPHVHKLYTECTQVTSVARVDTRPEAKEVPTITPVKTDITDPKLDAYIFTPFTTLPQEEDLDPMET
ncbi:proliferation associated protein [Pelomyxa schiedti]|nr:proliferation associated protein [Pelomyxa schiedti]